MSSSLPQGKRFSTNLLAIRVGNLLGDVLVTVPLFDGPGEKMNEVMGSLNQGCRGFVGQAVCKRNRGLIVSEVQVRNSTSIRFHTASYPNVIKKSKISKNKRNQSRTNLHKLVAKMARHVCMPNTNKDQHQTTY
eukprot:4271853-Amphidinium_carterae.1